MYCLISSSLPGYSGSEDCVAMETLLQGYDEQDEDQVYRVCNSPLLKYMDNDVSTKVSLVHFIKVFLCYLRYIINSLYRVKWKIMNVLSYHCSTQCFNHL